MYLAMKKKSKGRTAGFPGLKNCFDVNDMNKS